MPNWFIIANLILLIILCSLFANNASLAVKVVLIWIGFLIKVPKKLAICLFDTSLEFLDVWLLNCVIAVTVPAMIAKVQIEVGISNHLFSLLFFVIILLVK